MVAEGDRLRPLQVRVTRHGNGCVGLGQGHEGQPGPRRLVGERGQLAPQPQANVESDLVVAAPTRVQLAGHPPDRVRQGALDVHVHVLTRHRELEPTCADLSGDRREPPADRAELLLLQDPLRREHAGVRDRAGDVLERQGLVEGDGGVHRLDQRVGRLLEAATPRLVPAALGVFAHGPSTGCHGASAPGCRQVRSRAWRQRRSQPVAAPPRGWSTRLRTGASAASAR